MMSMMWMWMYIDGGYSSERNSANIFNPYCAGVNFRCKHLTYKVDPGRVKSETTIILVSVFRSQKKTD